MYDPVYLEKKEDVQALLRMKEGTPRQQLHLVRCHEQTLRDANPVDKGNAESL